MEEFIQQITKKAGEAVLEKFGKIGAKYSKEDANDVVTEADLLSNDIIIDSIKKLYPDHGIISEETGEHQRDAEYCWIIDPLDGTLNFATKIPLFAVIVGLAKKGEMQMGAVYNPCTKELLFAQKGKGAFLNGEKIFCSQRKDWKDSLGIIGSRLTPRNIKVISNVLEHARSVSCRIDAFGSFGVSTFYLASGRRDWQVLKRGLLWDVAAPALILQEAGCEVTNFKGQPWTMQDTEIAVSNTFLHPTLLQIVKDI